MHRSSFKFSEYSNVKLYQIRIILRVKSSKIGNFRELSGNHPVLMAVTDTTAWNAYIQQEKNDVMKAAKGKAGGPKCGK